MIFRVLASESGSMKMLLTANVKGEKKQEVEMNLVLNMSFDIYVI